MNEPKYAFLSIGFGGWSMKGLRQVTESGSTTSNLSHYGDTWKTHLSDLAPDSIAVDLTRCESADWPGNPSEALVKLSIAGPMADPNVPEGMRRTLNGDQPYEITDDRPYGAGSLDYINPRDYARLAAAIGARVFDPHTDTDLEVW